MTGPLFFLLLLILFAASFGISIYGVVLSFRKGWKTGVASIFVPYMAFLVGLTQLFGKDLIAAISEKFRK